MEDTAQTIAIVVLTVWVIYLHAKLKDTDREARSYKSPPRY